MLNSAFASFTVNQTCVCRRICNARPYAVVSERSAKDGENPSSKSDFLPVLSYSKRLFVKGVAIIICIRDINFIALPPGFAMGGSGNNHG